MASESSMNDDNQKGNDEKGEIAKEPASVYEMYTLFVDETSTKLCFLMGILFGILNGLVYPALAFLFSNSFTSLGGTDAAGEMKEVDELAVKFVLVGTYAMVVGA